jgi:hypothetical protein
MNLRDRARYRTLYLWISEQELVTSLRCRTLPHCSRAVAVQFVKIATFGSALSLCRSAFSPYPPKNQIHP